MLELLRVNSYYGESHILHDVSLRVGKGEVVSLLGRNGVGKTTTLRTIMGLVPPRSGAITFRGRSIAGRPPYEVARQGLGFVPEERAIFPTLTVHENLLLGVRKGRGGSEGTVRWSIDQCYEYFPSLQRRRSTVGRVLSGGEKQMLAVARALLAGPSLILMDEPTEGLDPIMTGRVEDAIRQIHAQGVTILLVEQKLKMALALSDRIYVISKGMVRWEGTPAALREDEATRKTYLEV